MSEGRVPKIVGQAQGLRQILIEAEGARHRPADLRDFEAVGEADSIMIAVGRNKDLGLVTKAAEGHRMDQAVAVPLEDVARTARAGIAFWMEPAARRFGTSGDAGR
jgi:hypothetical protein